MPTPVRVTPVEGGGDLRRFLRLPRRIYRDHPLWVPPLLSDQRRLLNPRRHPFHQHADVRYFLALRGGAVVGRVAAVVNHQYVQFHNDPTGFFGFFECADDQGAASALLEAAEEWTAARGMRRVRGPMSFSTNEECALLVDGFDLPPAVMMPYNPPYYPRLIEAAGYGKSKDLLAYLLDEVATARPPERIVRGVARLQRARAITIRPIDLRRFREEVARIQAVYNSAWERNWGFIPLTPAEVDDLARQLRTVGHPNLCLLAEVHGEVVGFALALPDYNQALHHMGGKLFPLGFLKFLWYKRKINAARVITLGLKPGFRQMGIDAMLYLRLWHETPRLGYRVVECSWILEDNWPMRRGLERMGAVPYKTYRMYEKAL